MRPPPAGATPSDQAEARRLLRYYALITLGYSRSRAKAELVQPRVRLRLGVGQYGALADAAGPRFRQLWKWPRAGSGSAPLGMAMFRWAVDDANPAQVQTGAPASEPHVTWVDDKISVPAPSGVNRRAAASTLGPTACRKGQGIPTAEQTVQSVWRSILYVSSVHSIVGGLSAVTCLCLTVPMLLSAKRHNKDSGVPVAAFWAAVLYLVVLGWVGGAVAPDYSGSVWWDAAATTLAGLPEAAPWVLGDECSRHLGALCRPLLPVEPDPSELPVNPPVGGVPCFLENPHGMLMKRPFMRPFRGLMRIVTYCSYGFLAQKRTCIWAFHSSWTPRPTCRFRCFSCLLHWVSSLRPRLPSCLLWFSPVSSCRCSCAGS
jgi:hypothetical protein